MPTSFSEIPQDARDAFDAAVAKLRAEIPEAEGGIGQWLDLAREEWGRAVSAALGRVASGERPEPTTEERAESFAAGARYTVLNWTVRWERGRRTSKGKRK